MLNSLLEDAGLTPGVCASLLGISPQIFKAWSNGTRDLPGDIIPELASVLGVTQNDLSEGQIHQAPAIWFKFRGDSKLSEADRELVLLIRRLGYYADQLDAVTSSPVNRWKLLFNEVMSAIQLERQASPAIQGSEAAKAFRGVFDLGFPTKTERVTGNGELIRPRLRSFGILVIEMPIHSNIQGCSFYVGEPGKERPCLFVNTYKQTWFRRNHVLMHELAHAMFDIATEAASIDFRDNESGTDVKEVRAEAFAHEALISKEMLRHLQSMLGLKWESLTHGDLASLVAYSQVELNTIVKSAVRHGFFDSARAEEYLACHIHDELRRLTERALETSEYNALHGDLLSVQSRMTTIPSRSLRLPVTYIARVLKAINEGLITESRAAEMLMVDDDTFAERFADMVQIAA
jgi:Zn-dependent peptidase ImmA (M78 family)